MKKDMRQTRLWMFAAILTILCGANVFTSCNKADNPVIVNPTPTPDPKPNLTKDFFPLWNKCEALTVLQEYVEDVTNPKSPNFISAEDRIVTFDMDGTFIGELYPSYFEYNMLEYRAPMMCARRHRTFATSCATARNCPTIST